MMQVVWWPLIAGIGLLVLLVAQPVGRPAPTLAQRLASLRPDQRPTSPPPTSFASPTLERLLVPPLRAAGRLLLRAAEVCGVPTGRLARRLALAGEPGGPALHAGQKLLGGLVGLGLLPLLTQLDITPFGAWPAWTWLATAIAGFVAPDLALAHKAARRRRELRSGLGTATEFLALAVAAGCGLEQALAEAATAGHGPFFTELAHRLTLARLQGQSGVEATAQLAADIDLPELAALAGALQAASRQGTPVLQTLRAQAHAARERRRLGLLEAGERAQVTMIVPVATLILPAFFLVILVAGQRRPAAAVHRLTPHPRQGGACHRPGHPLGSSAAHLAAAAGLARPARHPPPPPGRHLHGRVHPHGRRRPGHRPGRHQRVLQRHRRRLRTPHPTPGQHRMTRPPAPAGDQQGIATIEFVAVVWAFMVVVLGAAQFGLWWHAQHVVLAAAQDAARLAAAEDGTPAAGRARALDLLHAGLGRDAAGATVQVQRDGELASATVTGRLQPLLPIGDGIRLRATAHSFAEHFRPTQATP